LELREAAQWLLDGKFFSFCNLALNVDFFSVFFSSLLSQPRPHSPLSSLCPLLSSLNPDPGPTSFFPLKKNSFLLAAALALAAAKNAAAISLNAAGLSAAEEQAIRNNEADYSHFAELVATVMIVRGESFVSVLQKTTRGLGGEERTKITHHRPKKKNEQRAASTPRWTRSRSSTTRPTRTSPP